jgi:protein-tyrosine phosphatase
MGNICRSPTAHGVFEKFVRDAGLDNQIHIESAGTHAYHVGEPPDRRAQATASQRGYDLSTQTARRVKPNDFTTFDYVLAMDRDNYINLERNCPDEHREKLQLFLEFAPHLDRTEVPDPYYGGQHGFDLVLDMVEAASEGLLEHIRKRHL